MNRRSSGASWVVAIIVLVIIVGAVWYLIQRGTGNPAPAEQASPAASTVNSGGAAAIRYPIGAASSQSAAANATPLPPLAESDAPVADELKLLGGQSVGELLIPTQVIPNIVATIDALPRHALGSRVLPVKAAPGGFDPTPVTGQDNQSTLAADNSQRYAAYMQVVEHLDPKAAVDWYVHAYPLFQQAYVKLGYPNGYFNDRLIDVINNLLATPTLDQSPVLVRPKVLYEYADPKLESLSAGQKMILRAGPADAAKIKAKLRAIRDALTDRKLPATSASTASATTS